MSAKPNEEKNDLQRDEPLHQKLTEAGFSDIQAAVHSLHRIAPGEEHWLILQDFLPYLLVLLSDVRHPDRVMVGLERYFENVADRLVALRFLKENIRAVEILVRLFAGSQFLTEILLRSPDYLDMLVTQKGLAAKKTPEYYFQEGQTIVSQCETEIEQLDALRRFQRREFLRIGVCDLMDLYDMPAATRQLSHLAIGIIRTCLDMVNIWQGVSEREFVVIGMGKLGGKELNYSSDIDLLFLALSDAERCQKIGEKLIDVLSRVTTEGFLYRVDMRLRPWGEVGPLVPTAKGFTQYISKNARSWEKQALLKARVIAGNRYAGNMFLRRVKALIFKTPMETVRDQVYTMKRMTESYLAQHGRKWGEVKLGEGSIRDVEFTVQFLQLVHGEAEPDILNRNNLKALAKLHKYQYITVDEHRVLSDGYTFLRTIEHHLQLMHYRQTHTLPKDEAALDDLALRLGFQGEQAGEQFLARYQQHCEAVRTIYLRHVGGRYEDSELSSEPDTNEKASLSVRRHIERMLPSYSETFKSDEIVRHAALVDRLNQDNLVEIEAEAQENGFWRVTIVAYDYPGELSLICGLMFSYGLDINKGDVFTYELAKNLNASRGIIDQDQRRKIVDVFTVGPARGQVIQAELWQQYRSDLLELLQMMRAGQRREARVDLVKRVANSLFEAGTSLADSVNLVLYPVEIEIDNDVSRDYTVMHIEAQDTPGFLYELTNAMAFSRIYIARVVVDSAGNRVHDILYVTDRNNRKILAPERQHELRAATVLTKHFTRLLPYSPNPESALLHFREFIEELFKRPNWPDELASLEQPKVLHALARLLGVSDFLWDDFLRMQYESLFPVIRDVDALKSAKTRQQLQQELEGVLQLVHDGPQTPKDDAPWKNILNAFKDREMFRVDMRHILGHTREFWDFSAELTGLAEVVVEAAFRLCYEDLQLLYGTPYNAQEAPGEMVVCALGKCGGCEIGFASDIELLFIYDENGRTSGPEVITSAEFYEKLVQAFVSAIQAKREGIFEIDLRLRPYGKAGSLAVSFDAFKKYFGLDGPAWAYERQSLVKLRPIAGSRVLGEQVVKQRDAMVYAGEPFDVTAMRAMRERQIRHLVTGGTFHTKFSPGGLIDVEYLVQGLQIMYGYEYPSLRLTNTREAMKELAGKEIITEDDYSRLRKAHTFLRWLIDSLRVVRGNAKDITMPPEESEEYGFLTRRMNYGSDRSRLRSELARFTADVQELNNRLLT